jgi:hypothetical protein
MLLLLLLRLLSLAEYNGAEAKGRAQDYDDKAACMGGRLSGGLAHVVPQP